MNMKNLKYRLIGAPRHFTHPPRGTTLNVVWRDFHIGVDPLLGRVTTFLVKVAIEGDDELCRMGIGIDMTPLKDGTASPELAVLAGFMAEERINGADILVLTYRIATVLLFQPDYLKWAPQRKPGSN
jgi:hypothetical protein